jgi:hypothetical protein
MVDPAKSEPDESRPDASHGMPPGLISRPRAAVLQLPLEYRWEFTRRHPYYLQFWEWAHKYYAGSIANPLESQWGRLCRQILLSIQMTGDPPPPSAGPEALMFNQLGAAWRGGAIAPLTYRSFAGLLTQLPREIRVAVGRLLSDPDLNSDPGADPRKKVESDFDLLAALSDLRDPALDRSPAGLIVGVNLNTPQRAVVEAVEKLVGESKKDAGINESRRRHDVLPKYLQAWDLREGWLSDHYDLGAERSFPEIAKQLRRSARTVANQYASAFKLISGHPYSFETWARLFIVVKLCDAGALAAIRRRRLSQPRNSPGTLGAAAVASGRAIVPVPESVVAPRNEHEGRSSFIAAKAVAPDSVEIRDLIMDITDLLKQRYTVEAIVERLGLDPQSGSAIVEYVRQRFFDPVA